MRVLEDGDRVQLNGVVHRIESIESNGEVLYYVFRTQCSLIGAIHVVPEDDMSVTQATVTCMRCAAGESAT